MTRRMKNPPAESATTPSAGLRDAGLFDPDTPPTKPTPPDPVFAASVEPIAAPDPFDLEALRLPQDFGAALGVEKRLIDLPVRRPDRQWFVRTHPTLRIQTATIELRDEGEVYLVAPAIRAELPNEVIAKALILSITRQGLLFFWPIRLPDETGRIDRWNYAAMRAAQEAEHQWISIKANRHAGSYDVGVATGNFPEPKWPTKSLKELLQIAFRERYIDSLDHPVVKQLSGAS